MTPYKIDAIFRFFRFLYHEQVHDLYEPCTSICVKENFMENLSAFLLTFFLMPKRIAFKSCLDLYFYAMTTGFLTKVVGVLQVIFPEGGGK